MLRDAHEGMEKMSAIASAVKDERWSDAERRLGELESIVALLSREVSEKVRETISAPKPDTRDRG